MAINSLTGTASPGVSVDDGFTEKFKVFCRPPQTRNNNNNSPARPETPRAIPRTSYGWQALAISPASCRTVSD